MLVVYNEQSNTIGVWVPGWDLVLVKRPVFAYRGGKLQTVWIEDAQPHDDNWTQVGQL